MTTFGLWFIWAFLSLSAGIHSLSHESTYTQPKIPGGAYGAPNIVGQALEPCDTEHTISQATILSSNDDWELRLTVDAQPGDVFLLKEGVYQATDKLWLPAGTASAPIIIKPYDCAAVTIQSSLRPNSYTVIAGIRLEAIGIDDTKWAIRFDGKNRKNLTNIIVRNNTILGGTIDAIRINDDVQDVTIQGNYIDGGRDGHDIFVTSTSSEGQSNLSMPDAITITENRLTKQYFATTSEDMFQVRDVGLVTFTHNTCADGYDMEQCIDIKTTSVPLVITHNLFDGGSLHQVGNGEDGAGGCMVIHEDDGVADQHLVEYNYFHHCKGTVIRFAPGSNDTQSSALFRYNLLIQQQGQQQIIPIESAMNVHFLHNTILYGLLKLGNSGQSRLPENLLLEHNIFYQTEIEDNLLPPDFTYTCRYNLFFQLTGTGFTSAPCVHTITSDPLFVNIDFEDFHLQNISPALNGGENGATIGALPVGTPIIFDNHIFLPFITNTASVPRTNYRHASSPAVVRSRFMA